MNRHVCLLLPLLFKALILSTPSASAQAPVVTLLGADQVTNECFTDFDEPGAIARTSVTPLAAGSYHSLAIGTNGTAVAWGINSDGQTSIPASATNIVALAGGGFHSLAVRKDGTVIGWGANGTGQSSVPAYVTNIVAVTGGENHSVALNSDGVVFAWGWNGQGQTSVPASATNVVSIAARVYFNLALRRDGAVVAWGSNGYSSDPVPASATNIVAIATGGYHNLALRSDGTILAWGYNYSGQTNVPVSATNIVAVAAGAYHSLALRPDGTLLAWGNNSYDQTTIPAGATNIIAIAAGYNHSLALRSDGTLFAWGSGSPASVPVGLKASTAGRYLRLTSFNPGILGTHTIYYTATSIFGGSATATRTVVVRDTTPPVLTITGDNPLLLQCPDISSDTGVTATDPCVGVVSLGGGWYHSVALRSDGSIAAWGRNSEGQCNVPASATNIVAISSRNAHNVALRSDGTVQAWGWNQYGQANVPTSATNIVAIAAGAFHNVALRRDGTVLAWGVNSNGEATVPEGATNIVAIAAGDIHNTVLRSDGVIFVWGYNYFGQTDVPPSATNIVAIANGGYHSMVLRADGTVVAWGYNSRGQTNVPATATNIVDIVGGGEHSLALRSDGTVLAWGSNGATVPDGATNIVSIGAGYYHSLALRSDGTVFAWGADRFGETTVPDGLSDAITNITVTGTVGWGTNTLNYAAADPSGNTGTVQRTVIVADTTPPVISACASNQSVNSDASGFCTVPEFTSHVTAADNCTGVLNIVQSPVAGSQLSPGSYPMTLTVTDVSGNSNQCVTTFYGVDHTPPFITQCATNRQIAAGPGCQATVPDLTNEIVATDNLSAVTIVQTPAAGTSVGLGVTTVDFWLYDSSLNSTNCSMLLTVADTTPPSITCPSNIVTAATNGTDAIVNFADPIVSDNCTGTVTIACVPPSVSAFSIGTNTVVSTATDTAGNTNTCSFSIIVADITPPTITCPSNIVASANSVAGAIATFSDPVVSDNYTGTINVVCLPASGSTFPIGTNTVNVTATDGAGNTNTCSFTVTVTTETLTITKQRAKVNFVKPLSDSTSFTANLDLPDDFAVSNKVVIVDIGGVSTDSTLNRIGKSKLLVGSCTLKPKKLGGWIISVNLKGGNWSDSWTDDGLTNETIKDKPVTLPVLVTANGQVFTGSKPLHYKARQNKSGSAK